MVFDTMSCVRSAVSFNEQDTMRTVLKCMSLPSVTYSQDGSHWRHWNARDLVTEEGLIHQVQLLLLGEKRYKRSVRNFGLWQFVGPRDKSLRRAGCFDSAVDEASKLGDTVL